MKNEKVFETVEYDCLSGSFGVNTYMANDLFSSGDLNLKSMYSLADALAEEQPSNNEGSGMFYEICLKVVFG